MSGIPEHLGHVVVPYQAENTVTVAPCLPEFADAALFFGVLGGHVLRTLILHNKVAAILEQCDKIGVELIAGGLEPERAVRACQVTDSFASHFSK